MRRAGLPLALAVCAVLGACETMQIQPPSAVVEESRVASLRVADLGPLLAYFERIEKLAPAERAQEYERAMTRFSEDKSQFARLQLALFGLAPGASAAERTRSLALLHPLLEQKTQTAPARSFAVLLASVLTEADKRDANMQNLKDNAQSLKESAQSLSQRMKEGQRREAVLQERVGVLQEKLDALKDMEMNLMDREKVRPIQKK